MSATTVAFLLVAGLSLLALHLAPKPYKDVFAKPIRQRTLQERIQQSLRLAGVFDRTPTFILGGLIGAILTVGVVASVVLGTPFGMLVGIVLVPLSGNMYLVHRQRRFMKRAESELVPFLNRMVTSVKAGKPAQTAYLAAVYDSKELRYVLGDSASKINAGVPFRDALIETIPEFPLRMWAVFVRQLEQHDELGGNLGEAIEQSVSQVNNILQLHAEARADYAAQDQQQKLVALIAVGGTVGFALMASRDIIEVLWTTVLGAIVLFIAVSIMSFGLWFSRKQLRDFEKKANL